MTFDIRRAAILVGLVAGLVYANSLGNGFAYDDVPIIENNPTIQTLDELPTAILSSYWPGPSGANMALWRPVTTVAMGLQYVVGGGSPVIFHVTNVALHVAASVLLVLLLGYFVSKPIALVAGLIFAVHPVHTEAVANVVGVAELISAVAVLAACLIHVRAGISSSWWTSIAIGLLYAVGFGAKESAVTLPGLVFLIDAAREPLGLRELPGYLARRWRAYFTMFVVAMALLTARLEILGSIASPSVALGSELLHDIPKIWTLGEIWTHYVRLWIFPLDLSSDYSPNVIPISWGWHAANIAGVTVVLAALFGALAAWRRGSLGPGSSSARAAAFGLVWFGIAISPISNTLFLSGVLLAERTLYLPSAGLAVAVAWLFVRMARERPRAAPIIVVALLVAASVRTWVRNPAWQDNSVVFTTMVRDYPHSGRSQWILGDNFFERGQLSESLFAYRAAISLLDSHYALVTHVVGRLIALERYEGAEGLLDMAIRDRPTMALAYGQRAGIRAELGDAAGTERYARISLALYSRDPIRLHIMAWALASRGAWEEASEARRRADELGPADFWQRWVYDAHALRRAGNLAAMDQALDSARVKTSSERGLAVVDSIIRTDFAGSRVAEVVSGSAIESPAGPE